MSDLETLTRRDVEDYYRRFYGPNNAVVTIVGDVDLDQAMDWVEEYLAPIPRREDPPPVLAVEPPQRGERRVEVVWDAEPAVRIGWRVPSALHRDAPALSILSAILTGGRTSRLYRRMVVEDRVVTGVFSSIGPGTRFPRLFQLDATPLSPHTPSKAEEIVYEEVARIAADGPTESELTRVRNQIAAGGIRRLQSNLGLAYQLADSESVHGDWRVTFQNADRLRAVTTEDVRRVAEQYLTKERRTVATLVRKEDGR